MDKWINGYSLVSKSAQECKSARMFKRKANTWTFLRRYPDLHQKMKRNILIKIIIDLKNVKFEKL
jgi:hypothetical protein